MTATETDERTNPMDLIQHHAGHLAAARALFPGYCRALELARRHPCGDPKTAVAAFPQITQALQFTRQRQQDAATAARFTPTPNRSTEQ